MIAAEQQGAEQEVRKLRKDPPISRRETSRTAEEKHWQRDGAAGKELRQPVGMIWNMTRNTPHRTACGLCFRIFLLSLPCLETKQRWGNHNQIVPLPWAGHAARCSPMPPPIVRTQCYRTLVGAVMFVT